MSTISIGDSSNKMMAPASTSVVQPTSHQQDVEEDTKLNLQVDRGDQKDQQPEVAQNMDQHLQEEQELTIPSVTMTTEVKNFLVKTLRIFTTSFVDNLLEQIFCCEDFVQVMFVARRYSLHNYMSNFGEAVYLQYASSFKGLRILAKMDDNAGEQVHCTIINYEDWIMSFRMTRVMAIAELKQEELRAKEMLFGYSGQGGQNQPSATVLRDQAVSPLSIGTNSGRPTTDPLVSTDFGGGGSCGDTRIAQPTRGSILAQSQ